MNGFVAVLILCSVAHFGSRETKLAVVGAQRKKTKVEKQIKFLSIPAQAKKSERNTAAILYC